MTPTQRAALLLGKPGSGHGWRARLSRILGVAPTTIDRWGDDWPRYATAFLTLAERAEPETLDDLERVPGS